MRVPSALAVGRRHAGERRREQDVDACERLGHFVVQAFSQPPSGFDLSIAQFGCALEGAADVVAVVLSPLGEEAHVRLERFTAEDRAPELAVGDAER